MPKNSKVIWILAIALIAGLAMFAASRANNPGAKVVASVNGVAITQDELQHQLLSWKAAPVLDEMIDNEVFSKLARKSGVTVSEKEIDERLKSIKKDTVASLPFEKLIRLRGFTMEHIRDQIRRRLLIEKTIMKSIDVSDEQLTKVRASHILIQIKQTPNADAATREHIVAEAKTKAEMVLREARKPGADFAALARKYSDDPTSKNKGGDIGVFRKATGASALTEAAFKLKPGEIDIVGAPYGFHIVKCMDIIRAKDMPKDEAEKMRRGIREEEMAMTIDEWTEKTKAAAKIRRYSYK